MPDSIDDIKEDLRRKREARLAANPPALPLPALTDNEGAPLPEPDTLAQPLPAPSVNRQGNAHAPAQRAIVPYWAHEGRGQAGGAYIEPPHSEEAEQGLLASIIIDPKYSIPLALQEISVAYFYVPAHRTVFQSACELFTTQGTLDFITLTQYMRDSGTLASVGGAAFITQLFTVILAAGNIGFYIDILRDKYALREIISTETEFVRRAYEEQADVDGLLRELAERAERTAKMVRGVSRLPALADLSLLTGANRPAPPPQLVEGILHQGSKLIVGGTSKGRKTFALMDLAISVAAGRPWWGFQTVKGPVCYINFEIQESFFCGRVEDICRGKGPPGEPLLLPPGNLMGWNLRGHGEGIENIVEDLLFVLRSRTFSLIVIDPIYKALGDRDENKAGDVASMLNQLERIAVRTGAAVAFGAHYSKGNQAAKESIDRIGGSGVFARDPDSILTMTAHQEPEAFTVDSTLRNFVPIKPFVLKWDWPLFSRAEDLDPEELKQPKKASNGAGQFKPRFSLDDILDHLSIGNGIKPSALKNFTNALRSMSRATFYRLAGELERKGLLIEKDGQWFRGSKEDQKSV